MRIKLSRLTLLLVSGVFLSSCSMVGMHERHEKMMGHHKDMKMHHHEKMMMMKEGEGCMDSCAGQCMMPATNRAVAVLHPTAGSNAEGIVTFTKTDSGVRVVADLKNLSPGKHGFHIHQFGDISSPDGKSAGGHFNPEDMPHSGPMSAQRHEGDLGNVTADANGNAHLDYVDTHIKLIGPDSIIARGIILHAGEDDLKTQPTGAAGARAAAGVIGIAKGM